MPNVIRHFDTSWEDMPQPSSDTAVIERDGKTYAIGTVAKTMKGRSAFDKGKLSMMFDSVFAALEPAHGQSILRVENLKIAVPDTRNAEAIAESKKLVGTFEYCRNGQPLIATIAKVTLIEEATAAYNYGIQNNLYQWTDAINGVIDFGGGTSSGRLYTADGLMLREASITLPGTNALAQAIQARLLKETGTSADLSQVMDGIENSSYQIGRNGATFITHFASARDSWLDDIRSRASAQWSAYLNDLGEVLLVGGSASLATSLEERTKKRFKVASNPQDITILGMGV
jgi:molecular chaperone DnaK (HSP70)